MRTIFVEVMRRLGDLSYNWCARTAAVIKSFVYILLKVSSAVVVIMSRDSPMYVFYYCCLTRPVFAVLLLLLIMDCDASMEC